MIRETHVIAISFAIFMILVTLLLYSRKKISIQATIAWCFVWSGLILGSLLFESFRYIANDVLDVEIFDLFVILSVVLIFVMIFSLNNKVSALQKSVEETISEVALRDGIKHEEKKSLTSRKKE